MGAQGGREVEKRDGHSLVRSQSHKYVQFKYNVMYTLHNIIVIYMYLI